MQQQNIKERLAKAISRLGYCSRREAEKLIACGAVKVNGIAINDVVTFVSEEDVIEVENVKLTSTTPKIWAYYKPRGLITTHNDPQGRPTVFDNLPIKNHSHIISVGRLDIESEGLLLLTNNGEIARKLELPSNNYERIYKVKLYGDLNMKDFLALEKGITIDSISYKPCKITHIQSNIKNHWFEIKIYEGKNREIRRLFEYIGLQVSRLIRISYYIYHLENLKPGEAREEKINSELYSK